MQATLFFPRLQLILRLLVLNLLVGAAPVTAAAQASAPHDADSIETMIRDGARDCVAGNPQTPLSHFSSDIVLTYSGVADQGLEQLRASYAELCSATAGAVESTEPMFEEVRINGDTAIVRIVWRTHLRAAPAGTFRFLRDMQIWERLPEGWRFTRGVHFPVRPDDPAAAGWHVTNAAHD